MCAVLCIVLAYVSVYVCVVCMLSVCVFSAITDKRSVCLIILYMVIVTIMLLNLLIAMMGDTYAKIAGDTDKQWHLEV